MSTLAKYRKFITALIGAAVIIVGRHYGLTSNAYLDIVTVATALGVYGVPND